MQNIPIIKKIKKGLISIGYEGLTPYLLRFFLPCVLTGMVVAIIMVLFGVSAIWGLLIFSIGVIFGIAYPMGRFFTIRQNITNRLHFFITYAGTIATMKISRGILFQKIAEKKIFGEISKVFEKTLYLAKSWNLGFARASRIMGERTPSPVLSDFLDRLAIIMDFGEDLDLFLYEEQGSVLEDYAVEYQKSVEHIKLVQEFFVSLSISFAFVISIILLAPLLLNMPLNNLLIYSFLGVFFINVMILIAVKAIVPGDGLFNSGIRNRAQKKMLYFFIGSAMVSVFIFLMLFIFTDWNFLLKIAIASTPLIYPAILSSREEKQTLKRDYQFPIFTRVFGAAIEVRNGGVISALESTQSHFFGELNDIVVNLFKRLKVGADKFKSWSIFAAESGSNLIANFCRIFSEAVYLGGRAEKIGQIISENMNKLLSLRKLRDQAARGMRATIYGSFIGATITIFVTARVSQVLVNIFRPGEGVTPELEDMINAVLPVNADINFGFMILILSAIVIVMALSSSIMIKLVDGGSLQTAFFDFVILVWIGAIMSIVAPMIVDSVIPQTVSIT